MSENKKCTVRDSSFVDPCEPLSNAIDHGAMGKVKGIFHAELWNMTTGEPSRSYVGAKTAHYSKGILFNFCPFCGGDISAPFQLEDEGAAA